MYTEIVPDAKAANYLWTLVIHSDGWRAYDGLVDLGYEKHFRVNHGANEFSDSKGNHINDIESFWGYAKHRLVKFKGIPKKSAAYLGKHLILYD